MQGSIRIVKFFTYENPFLQRMSSLLPMVLHTFIDPESRYLRDQETGTKRCCQNSVRSVGKVSDPVLWISLVALTPDRSYAVAFSLPVLSASLAFVTYTETKKNFDPAIIFASFSLFYVRSTLNLQYYRFRILANTLLSFFDNHFFFSHELYPL
jgi:hypothetical protein